MNQEKHAYKVILKSTVGLVLVAGISTQSQKIHSGTTKALNYQVISTYNGSGLQNLLISWTSQSNTGQNTGQNTGHHNQHYTTYQPNSGQTNQQVPTSTNYNPTNALGQTQTNQNPTTQVNPSQTGYNPTSALVPSQTNQGSTQTSYNPSSVTTHQNQEDIIFDNYLKSEISRDSKFASLVTEFKANARWNVEKNPQIRMLNLARYATSVGKLKTFLGLSLVNGKQPTGDILNSLNQIFNQNYIRGDEHQSGGWYVNELEPLTYSPQINEFTSAYVNNSLFQHQLVHSVANPTFASSRASSSNPDFSIWNTNKYAINSESIAYDFNLLSCIRGWIKEDSNISSGWGHRLHILQKGTTKGSISIGRGPNLSSFVYDSGQ